MREIQHIDYGVQITLFNEERSQSSKKSLSSREREKRFIYIAHQQSKIYNSKPNETKAKILGNFTDALSLDRDNNNALPNHRVIYNLSGFKREITMLQC